MRYEYWFCGISQLPSYKKIALKEYYKSAETIYHLPEKEIMTSKILTEREQEALRAAQRRNPWQEEEYCIQNNIQLTVLGMENYPSRLIHIHHPPYGLYFRGRLPREERVSVAVVGARECSEYGRILARQIGTELSECGIEVISGMASGIDGAAHRGVIFQNEIPQGTAGEEGAAYSVLGSGVDICYPVRNRDLYEAIPKKGGVISEYSPQIKPLPANFPLRNRIISGLSDCVIVVEARKKSGSLITADFALEQGKEVYAVPGRLSDELSRGTNGLISQGAGIFLTTEEFLEETGFGRSLVGALHQKRKIPLENSERLVYSCVDLTPRNLEELMEKTGLSYQQLVIDITSLCKKDYIQEIYKNYYIRSQSGESGE